MSDLPPSASALRVSDLPRQRSHAIALTLDRAQMAELADDLALSALRKLSLKGTLAAHAARDWRLEAHLGATIVQPCGITLDPVTTRIDTPVFRLFQAEPESYSEAEMEMPEDDTVEPLGRWIDPMAVLREALMLALPLYPRKEGAALGESLHTAPGVAPLRDEDARPFAGLAGLRDQLSRDEGD